MREGLYGEDGELVASFCPTDTPLSDKGRAALEAMVKAVRKDMAAESQQLDLEAIERRWDRVLARKDGRQQGEVGLVAMISAADVPDLIAEIKQLRERIAGGHAKGCEGWHTFEMSCAEAARARADAAADLWACPKSPSGYHRWDVPIDMPEPAPGDTCSHGCGRTHGELEADLAVEGKDTNA